MKTVLILLLVAFTNASDVEEQSFPIVETNLGKIRGQFKKSFINRTFSAFEGIPYAQPPVGGLRFKEPEPMKPWEGIWDATYTYECVQTNLLEFDMVQGTEDCLYLNIYVPEVPQKDNNHDVIVHIHGGGFMFGAGHDYAHPDFFMDQKVIYVTLNYRLGVLGFLSTEDEHLPGNNGLKDQVLALKWIQKNIRNFGGNPDSVTLTGLSSGGSCVHLHYLSPLSKGLFHKGLSNSGVALQPNVLQENAREKAQRVAAAVGCPLKGQQLVECLRQRPFQHLMTKVHMLHGYKFMPVSIFGPVVEKHGKNRFLQKHPYEILKNGKISDLPWVVSNVQHEGLFPAKFFDQELKELTEKWDDVARFLLDFNYTVPEGKFVETSREIRKFYLGDASADFTQENYEKFVKIFTDRYYLYDAETAIRLHAKNAKSPVFYYVFSYPGETLLETNFTRYVSHAQDGQYFFYKMMNSDPSEIDLKLTKMMVNMLMKFVKTGKPQFEGVDWKAVSPKSKSIQFLNVTTYETKGIKAGTVEELSPRSFWDSVALKENDNVLRVKDEL